MLLGEGEPKHFEMIVCDVILLQERMLELHSRLKSKRLLVSMPIRGLLVAIPFDDEDEAVNIVNDTTSSIDVAARLSVGIPLSIPNFCSLSLTIEGITTAGDTAEIINPSIPDSINVKPRK